MPNCLDLKFGLICNREIHGVLVVAVATFTRSSIAKLRIRSPIQAQPALLRAEFDHAAQVEVQRDPDEGPAMASAAEDVPVPDGRPERRRRNSPPQVLGASGRGRKPRKRESADASGLRKFQLPSELGARLEARAPHLRQGRVRDDAGRLPPEPTSLPQVRQHRHAPAREEGAGRV